MAQRAHSTIWRTQNFLRRPALLDRLLDQSSIGPEDVVYDVGAGSGVITDRLAARCRRVVAVEVDPRLCDALRRRFADRPNVIVRCADFLDHPLPRGPYKVFANPPFDITTPVVTRLVSARVPPQDTYLMVQKGAANRYLGRPAETLYALLLKPWFVPSVVHRFRRDDFAPVPGVDVVLLRLRKRGPPLVPAEEAQLYRDFVVACFTAWQPTVGAALARVLGVWRAHVVAHAARIKAEARPSATPFGAWLCLFRAFADLKDPTTLLLVAGAEARLRRQQARLRKVHRTRLPIPAPTPYSARTVRPGESSENRSPPMDYRNWDRHDQPSLPASRTRIALVECRSATHVCRSPRRPYDCYPPRRVRRRGHPCLAVRGGCATG